jgi:hypothetical protein
MTVETALPVLSVEQRSWLQDTLEYLPRGQTAPVPRPSRTRTGRP